MRTIECVDGNQTKPGNERLAKHAPSLFQEITDTIMMEKHSNIFIFKSCKLFSFVIRLITQNRASGHQEQTLIKFPKEQRPKCTQLKKYSNWPSTFLDSPSEGANPFPFQSSGQRPINCFSNTKILIRHKKIFPNKSRYQDYDSNQKRIQHVLSCSNWRFNNSYFPEYFDCSICFECR